MNVVHEALVNTGMAILLAVAAGAWGQNYPIRPVKLVVPSSPGGGSDFIGRVLAPKLGEGLGQQVVVENRPGASSVIGADFVAKSAPDGYTVLISPAALAINPHMYATMPFDTRRDLAPVTLVVQTGNLLSVHPSLPVHSVKDADCARPEGSGKARVRFTRPWGQSAHGRRALQSDGRPGFSDRVLQGLRSGHRRTSLWRGLVHVRDPAQHSALRQDRPAARAGRDHPGAHAGIAGGAVARRGGTARVRGSAMVRAARACGHAAADHRSPVPGDPARYPRAGHEAALPCNASPGSRGPSAR